jgi:hypothetical protein
MKTAQEFGNIGAVAKQNTQGTDWITKGAAAMDSTAKKQAKRRNNGKSLAMYGISRIDSERFRTHAWRVKLVRRGQQYVRNFSDKQWGGKRKALAQAQDYRDELIKKYPPISRKEFCTILRSNNKTGITGVYRYAKSFKLKNGKLKHSWYWEATWPIGKSKQSHVNFSVNEYGEEKARKLAIAARKSALKNIDGSFWASSRGDTG